MDALGAGAADSFIASVKLCGKLFVIRIDLIPAAKAFDVFDGVHGLVILKFVFNRTADEAR